MSGFASVWPVPSLQIANTIGLPFSVYRPAGPTSPLVGSPLATTPVWVTGDSKLMATKSISADKPHGFAAVDPSVVQVGDYLVGPIVYGKPNVTLFVLSADIPATIEVILCSYVLSLKRPGQNIVPGLQAYGGSKSEQGAMATGWPAAVNLGGGKADTDPAHLPGSKRLDGFTILLPASFPVQLLNGDIFTDSQPIPNDYVVSSAQVSGQGWKAFATIEAP